MKNFDIITGYFFATLMLVGFASCEKENEHISIDSNSETRLIIRSNGSDNRVGEEEEEEVVQGQFQNSNGLGIPAATVELMNSSDTTLADSDTTDLLGEFEVSAVAGSYLFKVTSGSNAPLFTNAFELNEDLQVVIQQQ